MLNPDEIIRAFSREFNKMSYKEREDYLNRMGFSFDNKRHVGTRRYKPRYRVRISKNKARRGVSIFKKNN